MKTRKIEIVAFWLKHPLLITILGILGFLGLLIAGMFGWVSAVGASAIVLFLGAGFLLFAAKRWNANIESNLLLRSDEKLQNKDCMAIVLICCMGLLLGLCTVFAGADIIFPNRDMAPVTTEDKSERNGTGKPEQGEEPQSATEPPANASGGEQPSAVQGAPDPQPADSASNEPEAPPEPPKPGAPTADAPTAGTQNQGQPAGSEGTAVPPQKQAPTPSARDKTAGGELEEAKRKLRPPSKASYLALLTALASVAAGGAFGFLLGHPRRLLDEKGREEDKSGTSWLLRTGLDDIVDWLVKGITTVLLVQFTTIIEKLKPLTTMIGAGLSGPPGDAAGQTFAYCVIIYFTLFGIGSGCLVTRTYLTGALGRADRSTIKEFVFGKANLHWGEILTLVGYDQSIGRKSIPAPEVAEVAKKLAALSLSDLRTPQEIALWAKAKAMEGQHEEAIRGYEKAVLQSTCDAGLYLDFAVTLSQSGKYQESLTRLQQAYDHISSATPKKTVKNIYKSLTFSLLYLPDAYERVIQLSDEYLERQAKEPDLPFSGGMAVNRICAFAKRFRTLAVRHEYYNVETKVWTQKPGDMPAEMTGARDTALAEIKSLLAKAPGWRKRLEVLMSKDLEKDPEDDDLEVFESFPEFREAVGLNDHTHAPADEPNPATSP
jgi:tetratricopeptide (TPR) repeat protein